MSTGGIGVRVAFRNPASPNVVPAQSTEAIRRHRGVFLVIESREHAEARGIILVRFDNDGSEPFTEAQIATLIRLLADLSSRCGIPSTGVIGHGDMAPTRKRDPGILFPWRRLAEAGFGAWYADDLPDAPEDFDALLALQALGYDTRDLPAAVNAYKRRFRGSEGTELDARDAGILYNLLKN